jgi:hypothetical protein
MDRFHGLPWAAWRTNGEGVGAQLSDHQQRSRTSDESAESDLLKLGDSLDRQAGRDGFPCPSGNAGRVVLRFDTVF